MPSGFVVVDFQNSTECGALDDGKQLFNAVVVADIANKSPGSVVLVCAGQRTPDGWDRRVNNEVTSQCLKSPNDKPSADNVFEIIKKF